MIEEDTIFSLAGELIHGIRFLDGKNGAALQGQVKTGQDRSRQVK